MVSQNYASSCGAPLAPQPPTTVKIQETLVSLSDLSIAFNVKAANTLSVNSQLSEPRPACAPGPYLQQLILKMISSLTAPV